MSAKLVLLASALAMTVAGCNRPNDSGGAVPYAAKAIKGEDRRDFLIQVRAVAPVDEVRESVRLPATRYCIQRYGSSDIDWVIDPDTGDWSNVAESDGMTFAGRCVAR